MFIQSIRLKGAAATSAVLVLLFAPLPTAAADSTSIALGQIEYMQSCATCHGSDAKGGGPVAPALKTQPTNLTVLAQRSGGTFPRQQIRDYIDGQSMINPHGDRAMPVWGYRYLAEALQKAHEVPHGVDAGQLANSRIDALVDYLESIQVKG
ncbi:c-type cytochrome [Solirhodobacter olei]|uniref:c-type cytochrome n=1 Tax=Solirhodobacter olei TaxID=2493082 RepID=UPI000FD74B3E|nr:c-type cytochrome [Solirhodobacter olei]